MSRWSFASVALLACTGGPVQPAPAPVPSGPAPALVVALARVEQPTPTEVKLLPARVLILREGREPEVVDDPASNVFHKAIPWRDGLLTIGGDAARVVHWTPGEGGWSPSVLWEPRFGGTHDRIRDVEEGDVDGDGRPELVVATHDQGVVAVGDEAEDGTWTWTELSRAPDTFVHEIELGDLDGDGTPEIYATPSEPNQSSGASQPGRVVRFVHGADGFVASDVIAWTDTHAKEILVADVGDGPALFALREGRIGPAGGLREPVAIVQLVPRADGTWAEAPISQLAGERQARFLVAGDVDQDGAAELVATGMGTGVWLLDRGEAGWRATQSDGSSGGFEQAAHLADLDGDGALELYVASEPADRPREIRRYRWSGGSFRRDIVHTLEGKGLVWGLGSGTL